MGLSEASGVYSKTRTMRRPKTISKSQTDHRVMTAFHDVLWRFLRLELHCQGNTFPVLCHFLAKINKKKRRSNLLIPDN